MLENAIRDPGIYALVFHDQGLGLSEFASADVKHCLPRQGERKVASHATS